MRILILTEGGKNIGLGHVVRCVALCQALEERNLKPELFINGSDVVLDSLEARKYQYLNWLQERDEIFKIIKGVDVVIVDSFIADKDFYVSVSELVNTPVYLDDNNRLDFPRGLVINVSLFADELDYVQKENVVYLLGTLYNILRKEFWNVSNKRIRKNVNNLMVTFGGDDANDLTPKILDFLVEKFPQCRKSIIIGCWFSNIERIAKVSDEKTILIHNPDAEELKNIMLKSDLAISAGGQTLYELARIGLPVIGIGTAENQLHNLFAWERAGFLEYAGMHDDRQILDNILMAINKSLPFSERLKRSNLGKKYVDGRGVERISDYLMGN